MLPVKILFLLGRNDSSGLNVQRESKKYQDIIQEDFIDSYTNLTLKTVFALKWLQKNCLNQIAFFVKCDDDTFLHIPNLLHFLLGGTIPIYRDTLKAYGHSFLSVNALYKGNGLNSTQNILMGRLLSASKPSKRPSHKWYMPINIFPNKTYPPHLCGNGYLMSMDVVYQLYQTALNTSYMHLEDIYLTGICAENAQIERRNSPLFYNYCSYERCFLNGMITAHHFKSDDLKYIYKNVTNIKQSCRPAPLFYFNVKKN